MLKECVLAIEAISPEVRRFTPMAHGPRTRSYSSVGVHSPYGRIRNAEIDAGRFISDENGRSRRRVGVVGATLKNELYDDRPAVGSVSKIHGVPFLVIGVLKKKAKISSIPRVRIYVVVMPGSNHFREHFVSALRAALARPYRFSPLDERAVTIIHWNQLEKF
ncbi:MAG: ABC transporter permease [Verrucomicrobiae bacterium]|nr:ABC transporter permease [Verrucomicrobiae bacterium]